MDLRVPNSADVLIGNTIRVGEVGANLSISEPLGSFSSVNRVDAGTDLSIDTFLERVYLAFNF